MRPARPLIALLACLACSAADAQAIYRCGDSYSQQPCQGGRQLMPAGPAPTATDRSQAAAVASRDARLADTLEKDRTRREAQAVTAPAVMPAATVSEPEPHKWPEKAATRKLDVFTASVPGSRAPKSKAPARKAADKPKDSTSAKKSGKESADGSQARTVKPAKTAAASAARS